MSDTPQVLLAHHLKALKLPTFLREHERLARQCAAEGADHREEVPLDVRPSRYPEDGAATCWGSHEAT